MKRETKKLIQKTKYSKAIILEVEVVKALRGSKDLTESKSGKLTNIQTSNYALMSFKRT